MLNSLPCAVAMFLSASCAQAEAKQSPITPLEWVRTEPLAVDTPPAVRLAQAITPSVPLANPAKITVKMIPAVSVEVGAKVDFEVTSARRGFVLLVDIDPTGRMTQIFPNPELLEQSGGGDINLIQANGKLAIPSEEIRKRGFNYLATEPTGSAAIVAILSQKKVQLVDLPDTVANEDTTSSLSRLLKWIGELRVADPDSGKLLRNKWSYDFKSYEIR